MLEILVGCYRVSVPELIHEHSVSSTHLHGIMFQIHIVCIQRKNFLNHQPRREKSLIDGKVIDRGKRFGTINGCSHLLVAVNSVWVQLLQVYLSWIFTCKKCKQWKFCLSVVF